MASSSSFLLLLFLLLLFEQGGGEGADSLPARLFVERPKQGSVLPPSFDILVSVIVDGDITKFRKYYPDSMLCISLDHQASECVDFAEPTVGVNDLLLGSHSITASIVNSSAAPSTSEFTVVSREEYAEAVRNGLLDDDGDDGGEGPAERAVAMAREAEIVESSLVEWHGRQRGVGVPPRSVSPPSWACHRRSGGPRPQLVAGIKSYAGGFAARDALRRTWLSNITSGACAWFIVGALSDKENREGGAPLMEALRFEQARYGDLLLEAELGSINGVAVGSDGYFGLVAKTKAFMRFATTGPHFGTAAPQGYGAGGGDGTRRGATWRWLMMLDDDVYLRSERLVDALTTSAPESRFYAGQVWREHFGHATKPVRNKKHQNYLSEDEYPMDELPPFAIGPHYLISFDCAAFVGANADTLRGVGTLEDVSVALWMLALQVHPMHIEQFSNARGA